MTIIIPALLALICGAVLTTQVGSNTLLGKSIGNPYIPAEDGATQKLADDEASSAHKCPGYRMFPSRRT